jgi:predicted RNA-binding Zn-ribbon protein involved in translation (DUF1610 family)
MPGKKPETEKGIDPLVTISQRDIMFECPACGKSLVVDEAAAGLIVDCPQCHINVIVPPKITPPPTSAQLKPAGLPPEPKRAGAGGDNMKERLAALGNQLKELQTQRTEINNRIAARLNDLNRDLVLLARLETSQQQVVGEWQQVVGQVSAPPTPVVLGSSVSSSGRTRVQFTH